jgi:hypothetical protein
MRALRRALTAVLGTAGAAGLVLCIAGVVGCWALHAEAVSLADRVCGRAESSLGGVRDDLTAARDQLGRTQQELNAIRQREAEFNAGPPADRGGRRPLARKLTGDVPSQLGEARRRLVTATEAALAVNGFLDALAELTLSERVGVDIDRLRGASDALSELIGRGDKLSSLLAASAPDPAGAADQSSRIAESLGRVVAAVDEGAARADAARAQVGAWRARVTRGLTWAAALVTLILAWVGVGQLSLLAHACRWSRGQRRTGEVEQVNEATEVP